MDKFVNDSQLIALCQQLSGPAQTLEHLSLCDHNPDILALFIERLDHSDPAIIGNTLYSMLKELSALNIPPSQKLALLNLVHPLILRCAEKLSNTTLSPKTAKPISLAQALLKHLAAGFRTVVAGIGGSSDVVPIQQMIQAIAHALEVQGIMYLKSLQFYLDTPNHYWADVHLLYRIAEHCNIPRQQHDSHTLTIRCHYTRLLLLACGNPNKLPASDLTRIFKALPVWVDTARLSDEDSDSLFVVDTAADLPPFYRSQLATAKNAKSQTCVRGFNLQRLVNYLEGKLYNNPEATLIDNTSRRLVSHFCSNWSIENTRQSERNDEQDKVELVYGLSYAHCALADVNFEVFLNNLSTITAGPSTDKFELQELDNSRSQTVATHDPDRDIWRNAPDVARQQNQILPAASSMSMSGAAAQRTTETKRNHLQATLSNTSEQGACIEFDRSEHPRVTPGEVICCRGNEQDPWQLGLVRWKRITPHLRMQLGIEFLPVTPQPRAARVLRQNKAAGPYLPALLLSPQKGSSSQVILPIMPFKQGDKVHLLGGKRGMVAQLSVPIDATGHISRFTLEDASSQES